MIEIPGRIPIFIHPFFWVLAAFIGWMSSQTLVGMLIWIAIIFVSVLFHEYGHALTAVLFGQKTTIQLMAMGGATSYSGSKLKFWQQFLIVLNGPVFGFLLFVGATILLQMGGNFSPLLLQTLKMTQLANLFWTIVNLLPVMPLDGGQLLRIVLEAAFGVRGFKASLLIGAVISFCCSLGFFMVQFYLAGALFFLFAFQSLDLWRKSKLATQVDREEPMKSLLVQGEIALQEGKKSVAKELFAKVCESAQGGILAAVAAQRLSVILMEEGKAKEAYELLLPIQSHLADDARCLLHQLAAQEQNDELVAKLSAECYQVMPSQEMALRNARAFARLHQAKLAGGWLQAAWQYGGLKVDLILKEEPFLALKGDVEFDAFINQFGV
jgi:Zn-dependent protease